MQSLSASSSVSKRSAPADAELPTKRMKAAAADAADVDRAAAASEAQPGQVLPMPAPEESWFLAIKLEDYDAFGCHLEGHVQVLTTDGYVGMSRNGMHDPRAMRHPDIVLRGKMGDTGVAAMKAAEAELVQKDPPYDRKGVKGINCLMAASSILAAITGVPLQRAFAPEGKLAEFSEGVQRALADAGVPFEVYTKKDADQMARVWDGVRDKGDPPPRKEIA